MMFADVVCTGVSEYVIQRVVGRHIETFFSNDYGQFTFKVNFFTLECLRDDDWVARILQSTDIFHE